MTSMDKGHLAVVGLARPSGRTTTRAEATPAPHAPRAVASVEERGMLQ